MEERGPLYRSSPDIVVDTSDIPSRSCRSDPHRLQERTVQLKKRARGKQIMSEHHRLLFRFTTWGSPTARRPGPIIDGCPPRIDLQRLISSRARPATAGAPSSASPAARPTGSRSSPGSSRENDGNADSLGDSGIATSIAPPTTPSATFFPRPRGHHYRRNTGIASPGGPPSARETAGG